MLMSLARHFLTLRLLPLFILSFAICFPESNSQWVAAASPPVAIAAADLTESSGLAASHRENSHFWTHNDSGDTARLFAVRNDGALTGGCRLVGVNAVDFEDLASYRQDGIARLVVADVGDNRSLRPFVSLYFFDEPDPQQKTDISRYTRLDLQYPDGARDCESIAIDSQSGVVTLVAKSFLPNAGIYHVDLPPRPHANAVPDGPQVLPQQTLRRVGTLYLSLVTAMDHDPLSGDYLLVNYFQLFRFPQPVDGVNWWQQTPQANNLPKLKQIEAVAVDHQGEVWVTSEGHPAPLVQLRAAASPQPTRPLTPAVPQLQGR